MHDLDDVDRRVLNRMMEQEKQQSNLQEARRLRRRLLHGQHVNEHGHQLNEELLRLLGGIEKAGKGC